MEETEVANYAVEKSIDGNNFSTIHTTPAFNIYNSSYSYTDQQLSAGTYYYRVKMTDTKGSIKYSNTIKLVAKNEAGFSVYPNPAISNVTVHNTSIMGILTVSDLSGKVCLTQKTNSQNTSMNVGELKQGIYTITIQNGEQKQTTNFAIER